MMRQYYMRIAIVVGLIALIVGALYVAAVGVQQAPHQPDAQGGHDHNRDGIPDH